MPLLPVSEASVTHNAALSIAGSTVISICFSNDPRLLGLGTGLCHPQLFALHVFKSDVCIVFVQLSPSYSGSVQEGVLIYPASVTSCKGNPLGEAYKTLVPSLFCTDASHFLLYEAYVHKADCINAYANKSKTSCPMKNSHVKQ